MDDVSNFDCFFLFPCIRSVTDHRSRQTVVRTLVARPFNASCATFLTLPHSDVIYGQLLNRRTVTWNLFVLIENDKGTKQIRGFPIECS